MVDLRTQEAWHTIHQPFEIGWWREALKRDHFGSDENFEAECAKVAAFIDPHVPVERWGSIIDIGSGPRPFFRPCVAIEPLAREYQEIAPAQWWEGVTVHAQKAEEIIPGLKGDIIMCWNALDHAVGWREILDAMLAYGNPRARFAVATDFYPPFDGHPGFERDDFIREIGRRFRIVRSRERSSCEPSGRQLSLLLTVV